MKIKFNFLFLGILFSSLGLAQTKPPVDPNQFVLYCGNIYLQKDTKLDLKPMERRLICGDDKKDQIGTPWSEIPAKQAQFFLQNFLQSRAHHRPFFSIEGTKLYVRIEEITRLQKFEMIGGPSDWNPPRRRLIKGKPMTPALLNDLEGWTTRQLADEGYACSYVSGFADPDTGLTRVEINPGDIKPILDVIDKTNVGLAPGVADRYNAFRIGDNYSEQLVQLSRRRVLQDGLFQAVSLSHDCYPNGVIIKRDAVLGPPREFRVGIGGDTEEGPKVRLRAKQIRMGPTASNAETTLSASFKRQRAVALGRYFYSSTRVRDFLEPSIEYSRLDESKVESNTFRVSLFHAWQREFKSGQAELRFGPSRYNSQTIRGLGPADTTLVLFESRLRWTDHDSEYFEQSPREGTRLEVQLLRSQDNWGAPYSATRFAFQGQTLWNLPEFDPPLLVLGIRYNFGTTSTEERLGPQDLPAEFRFFGGGNENLRGYERQELPRSEAGALTQALIGAEARLYKGLFQTLDPFIFTDAGKFSVKSGRLESPTYISPGAGLRWESPVGVLRVFLAYGTIIGRPDNYTNDEGRLRFGLTFGEEF